MALKELAAEGLTFKIDGASGGNVSINSPASSKVKANNKSVYNGPMSITVTGTSSGACTQNVPAAGTINPTAEKCKVEENVPIRKGDKSDPISVQGTTGTSPCSYIITIEIDEPGQNKVKGN